MLKYEKKGKAFTILGSGDSVFQLLIEGFNDITAVDTNHLQLEIFSFRKAAISCLEYDVFTVKKY